MKKYNLNLTLLLVMVSSMQVFAQAPAMPAKPVVIDLVKESEVIPTMPITGNVYSINNLQFTSAIAGQLEYVAQPGTAIKAGDLIAKVDASTLDLQLQEQQALITRAEVQLKYLQTNLSRQKNLIKANSVSANSVEQIESQKDVAASDLAVAKLKVKQIEDQMSKSEIRAQHNGVITQRLRREGETISPGTIIGSLVDIDNLEIRVQLPLRYTSFVEVGQDVEVFAFGITQKGMVKSILPGVNNRNQAYELRVEIAKDSPLKIGQLVSVAVPIQMPQVSMVIHQDALVLREEGSFVYRVNTENKVEKVMVTTSTNLGHLIAVTGDLKPGDQIVIRGAETLQDGNEVTINPRES
jgi:RND family efflux transporter MFP subunit